MPHVDILFNQLQLQKRKNEPAQVKTAIENFEKCIVDMRNKIDDIINEAKSICTEPQGIKRRRRNNSSHDHRVAALEVCDNIVNSANDRIQFKDNLVAASLFFPEHFGEYCGKFPDDKLETTCLAYPELEKSHLKTKLPVIYAWNDCRDLHGTLSLLKFLIQNSLEETLKETRKLLEIIVTTPMSTSEAERNFSTLKRIKTFLHNTMTQDRLTALSMLSIEKEFISTMEYFNGKVIDKFAAKKQCRIELTYKK
ncbi:unnamed protein product [Acanthoscelides obtectus]|uniref:HAT C-terminal dimerisation domain-containing protein n=1 Tax=Acanthoscelides obtectus TaxID=200917 RepID=A0A9P0NUY4_ACAOB|nr:unnamed protein product [Acanthoscelides obtectus]CAK1655073.1 Zinc finger MYM-type protein 1 [Acanthoscelides obtectus]